MQITCTGQFLNLQKELQFQNENNKLYKKSASVLKRFFYIINK